MDTEKILALDEKFKKSKMKKSTIPHTDAGMEVAAAPAICSVQSAGYYYGSLVYAD